MMRGLDQRTGELFSYVDLEARVRADHPLRPIRAIVNEALSALKSAGSSRSPGASVAIRCGPQGKRSPPKLRVHSPVFGRAKAKSPPKPVMAVLGRMLGLKSRLGR